MNYEETIACLYALQDADKVLFKARKFGIISNNSLGIYHKDLQVIAKEIGPNKALAIQLFNIGIYEARLLCSKIYPISAITDALMEKWVQTFENWEICDSFCMGIFAKSTFAISKIENWTTRQPEFEKRAGFTIMAAYCMADKHADNAVFESFFSIIKREANDDRLYVKKAVNWALRNIGKRNIHLHQLAIQTAHEILEMNNKSAQWIAKNALSELLKDNIRMSDYPRAIYRNSKANLNSIYKS